MSPEIRTRVEVMHGVNLDQLGRRDPRHSGVMGLPEPDVRLSAAPGEPGPPLSCCAPARAAESGETVQPPAPRAHGPRLAPGSASRFPMDPLGYASLL